MNEGVSEQIYEPRKASRVYGINLDFKTTLIFFYQVYKNVRLQIVQNVKNIGRLYLFKILKQ